MKKFINILNVGLLAILMVFVGCKKDNDDQIIEEPHHEVEFTKAEFIFTEGHTHGLSFHGDPVYEGVKYLKNQQKVTYNLVDGKWVIADATPIRFRQSSYYGLEIVYYNAEGVRVNSEIIEEADVHQHFFQIENPKAIKTGTIPADINTLMAYTYRDTNPENKYYTGANAVGVELLASPVGLKGYFQVKHNYVAFDLKVSLSHFLAAKAKQQDGAYRPYNVLPSGNVAHSDFQVTIPVRIFSDRLDEKNEVQDLMDEFNISQEEAEAEIDAKLNADVDTESGQVWM
ncbi:MAG: hypothetical protein Q4C98_04895 [Capnocytophaga sp.]|nr:hypothetical protein [Capnocytophaga sp.]